jgi:ABC-2 type transport system permease protein
MFDLFKAELKRTWILELRYPLELVVGLLMMGITFYALFLGAKYLAGPAVQFGERIDALILGYGLWTLVLVGMNTIALLLQGEAQTGTLEQLYLSHFGPVRIILARSLSVLTVSVAISVGMLLLMLQLTGRRLSFPVTTLPPLACVVLGSFGLGFTLGALALVFKKVQEMMRLFQFSLLALVIVPVEQWKGSARALGLLLPIAPAAGQLRDLMARGLPFDPVYYGITVVNGAGHFALGLLLFLMADRVARQRGLLGQY